MSHTEDGFEMFRTTLGTLIELTVDVRGDRAFIDNQSLAPGLPAAEQQDLAKWITAVLGRKGNKAAPCSFNVLTASLSKATSAEAFRTLDRAVQLIATHWWERTERQYENGIEEAMIQWAKKQTGHQGTFTLSDAFGIWVTSQFQPALKA